MRVKRKDLENKYKSLSDERLISIYSSGGLTELAESILIEELTRRHIEPDKIEEKVPSSGKTAKNYASRLDRIGAFLIDMVILSLILSIYIFLFRIDITQYKYFFDVISRIGILLIAQTQGGYGLILAAVYFIGCHASYYQATPGKMLFDIRVTDYYFNKITLRVSIFRFILKIFLSFFFIGYIFVLFTKKRQGLYDIIARTYVVKK